MSQYQRQVDIWALSLVGWLQCVHQSREGNQQRLSLCDVFLAETDWEVWSILILCCQDQMLEPKTHRIKKWLWIPCRYLFTSTKSSIWPAPWPPDTMMTDWPPISATAQAWATRPRESGDTCLQPDQVTVSSDNISTLVTVGYPPIMTNVLPTETEQCWYLYQCQCPELKLRLLLRFIVT